jgi:SAM-dependent methyltransferase
LNAAPRWLFDPLGSTSWHNRHRDALQRVGAILRQGGPARPTIMILGPGGVSWPLARLLNDAARPGSALRKLIGDAARYGDQVLRRLPMTPLVSLEPAEVRAAMGMEHELIVVDRSRRILRAAARAVPTARCHRLDICEGRPPETADVVIAFNILCRLAEPLRALENVVATVRPGGYLMLDDRSAKAYLLDRTEFENVAPKIHRRAGGAAAASAQGEQAG